MTLSTHQILGLWDAQGLTALTGEYPQARSIRFWKGHSGEELSHAFTALKTALQHNRFTHRDDLDGCGRYVTAVLKSQREQDERIDAEIAEYRSKSQWVTGTELLQQERKSKTLKIALNQDCPVGMVEMPYAEIREHLHVAWGIDLNEIPKVTIHRVRRELNIETTGGVNPVWSRPTTEELCQN